MATKQVKNTTELLKNYFSQMTPMELKKEHIRQAKQVIRDMPELKDQIMPILQTLKQELADMELAKEQELHMKLDQLEQAMNLRGITPNMDSDKSAAKKSLAFPIISLNLS